MSPAAITLLGLAAITYALKAVGPLVLGGERELPGVVDRLTALLPIPLLAALVATSTVIGDGVLVADARLAGLVVAGVALWRRLPFVVVVILAAAATAAVRLLA